MSFNITAADNQANRNRKNKNKNFNLYQRKTLQEALDEAAKSLTPQQKRLQDTYGKKWAANGKGEGCIFK